MWAVKQLHPHRPRQHPGGWQNYRVEGAQVPDDGGEGLSPQLWTSQTSTLLKKKYPKASILFESLYFGVSLLQQLRPLPIHMTPNDSDSNFFGISD